MHVPDLGWRLLLASGDMRVRDVGEYLTHAFSQGSTFGSGDPRAAGAAKNRGLTSVYTTLVTGRHIASGYTK
jgi:hypothetical protein